MSLLFTEFVDEIIRIEGGFVDRLDDSGGPTKYGITQSVARRHGYTGGMKDLPRSLAVQIYKETYYDALNLFEIEKISPAVAVEMLDIAVNQGTYRAGEFFQKILNVMNNKGQHYKDLKVDADIGPASIIAFKSFFRIRGKDAEGVFVNALNCLQGAFYISLAERRIKDEAFVFGWFKNRVRIS